MWPLPDAPFRLTANDLAAYGDELDFQPYLQRAASKINSNGWDILTFIAEFASVRKMFQNILKNLRKLKDKTSVEDVASLWLEGRYGWRTLRYDILDMIEAIESLQSKQRSRFSENAGHTRHYADNEVVLYAGTGTEGQYDIRKVTKVEVSMRASIVADIDLDAISARPLQTAWELIPFSFIADWLIDVGATLQTQNFLANVDSYTASYGYQVKATVSSYSIGTSVPGYEVVLYDTSGIKGEYVYRSRFPTTVSYHPSILINIDSFKVLDLLALSIGRK
jgi:hypothetical protein